MNNQNKKNFFFTLWLHWRQRPHRSCWPEARRCLWVRPPWWWCGRWTRWRRGRCRSRHWPEPLLFQFHSETENLKSKRKRGENWSYTPSQVSCRIFFLFFFASAGGWRWDSNIWHPINTHADLWPTLWSYLRPDQHGNWLMLSGHHSFFFFFCSSGCRLEFPSAAESAHAAAAPEHIKRAQRLWNQTFQPSFLGVRGRPWVCISTARGSILRWAVAERVTLCNASEPEVLFSAKSMRVSFLLLPPRAGDDTGVRWLPRGAGLKSIADENEPRCGQTRRRE